MIGPSLQVRKLQYYTVVINHDSNVQHFDLSLTAPKKMPYFPTTEPNYARSDTYIETTQWCRIQRNRVCVQALFSIH
jgi:hypothetical protein